MKKIVSSLLALLLLAGCSSSGDIGDIVSERQEDGTSEKDEQEITALYDTETEYHMITAEEIPAGLNDFLNGFSWAVNYSGNGEPGDHEYDCTDGREAWIFDDLIWITNDFKDYDIAYYGQDENNDNVFDADEIDWILKNIYNFSAAAIDEVKQEGFSRYGYVTYSDGKYHGWQLGAFPGYGTANYQAAYNGDNYVAAYDCGEEYIDKGLVLDEPVSRHYALLKYKMIDGKGYWSIYKDTIYKETINGIDELFIEETITDSEIDSNEEVIDPTDWNVLADHYYMIYLSYLDFTNNGGDTTYLINYDPEREKKAVENYYKYNAGYEFTNQVFDFDVTKSKITDKGNGVYEADCYAHVINREVEIKTGKVGTNDVLLHTVLKYDPEKAVWILTSQEGTSYSYDGHELIHCAG